MLSHRTAPTRYIQTNKFSGLHSLNKPNRINRTYARKSAPRLCTQTKTGFCFPAGSIIVPRHFSPVSSLCAGIIYHRLDVLAIVVRFPDCVRDLVSKRRRQFWDPPSLLLVEQWVRFPAVVKRPEREAGCSSPSIAKAKNKCSYTSTPPHAFMVCTGTTLPSLLHTLLRFGHFIIIFGIFPLSIIYVHSAFTHTFVNATVPVTDHTA